MEEPGEDHLLELEESPYLRRQKQVEVRRGRLKSRWSARIKVLMLAGFGLGLLSFAAYKIITFGLHDSRFMVSETALDVTGLKYVTRRQVAERFAGDVNRSIFTVPLARRRSMLEEISWVEEASVVRAWPDRLRVSIRERVPVAFLRTASGLYLVDRRGVLMDRPPKAAFTFPVVSGFTEHDPIDAREERMRLYLALVEDLDRDGGHHSLDISEVDVTDPEDAKVIVTRDTADAILVHLGNNNFLTRYLTYLAHIRQWTQQFEKIQSIDLRYDRQIVVNPDKR